ncbi:MAG: hypothetical protein IPJ13_00625 [Saprospiraceae bacterium]|nr:hypothetical protein [Saprospiraceae bacterium]
MAFNACTIVNAAYFPLTMPGPMPSPLTGSAKDPASPASKIRVSLNFGSDSVKNGNSAPPMGCTFVAFSKRSLSNGW